MAVEVVDLLYDLLHFIAVISFFRHIIEERMLVVQRRYEFDSQPPSDGRLSIELSDMINPQLLLRI